MNQSYHLTPRSTRRRRIRRSVEATMSHLRRRIIKSPSLEHNFTSPLEFSEQTNLGSVIPVDNNAINYLSVSKKLVLKRWAVENNVTQQTLGSLLVILRDWLPLENFPKDPRTFIGTPNNLLASEITGGSLFHFGVLINIIRVLESGFIVPASTRLSKFSNLDNLITISVGIDGLPISKSSNAQFWPILGYVDGFVQNVFVISLYYGTRKPEKIDEFLRPFVDEMKDLEDNGFIFKNVCYKVRLRCIIADAPARSFIKCCKNHNAYYSCERCSRKGKWRKRVTYSGIVEAEMYTDESFAKFSYPHHQQGVSPLVTLDFGLISQIPLDYMHLCCLGVMKKLLCMWSDGPLPHKLAPKITRKITLRLETMKKHIPVDFNRKTRGLNELKHWKATEFRLFLVYVGPILLDGLLDKKKFEHFLKFHSAMYILISDAAFQLEWVKFAGSLLHEFVKDFSSIYSKESCVYNVHMLSHLHLDAKIHGRLDLFSAFPFENYMKTLKSFIHAHKHQLKQVVNRIREREEIPLINIRQNKRIIVKKNDKDNCYITDDSKICLLSNISDDLETCTVNFYLMQSNVSWYPINSSRLGIYFVSNLSATPDIISTRQLVKKCFLLPCKNQFFVVPLCHSCNE